MKLLLLSVLLASGCASRADLLRIQLDELSRDEKILDVVNRLAENQLLMAKKLTAKQVEESRADRAFLRLADESVKKTDEQFDRDLRDAQRELDAFMRIGEGR